MRAGDGSGREVANRLLDTVVVNGNFFARDRVGLVVVASRYHADHHAAGGICIWFIAGLAHDRDREQANYKQTNQDFGWWFEGVDERMFQTLVRLNRRLML